MFQLAVIKTNISNGQTHIIANQFELMSRVVASTFQFQDGVEGNLAKLATSPVSISRRGYTKQRQADAAKMIQNGGSAASLCRGGHGGNWFRAGQEIWSFGF